MAKTLSLPFARTKKLDSRITFTRASTGGYYGADGLYRLAANNEGRFDHDPATYESKGLLIEEQRTNLLSYSESFDNSAWVKTNATVTANAITAPDGTLTADKLVETATAGYHFAAQNYSAANTYSFSFFAKVGERSRIYVDVYNNTDTQLSVMVDLSTGTSSNTSIVSCTSVGGGWYRVVAFNKAISVATSTRYGIFLDNGASASYTGDGTSGIYLWGAQLEAGSFPTSYIPSADSFTSRASSATFIGSNGLIQSAATNVARYNYNPLNLTLAPKLLLEEQRTNLLTYSEQFDNAAWSKGNATVAANAAIAPDGALTAEKLVEDTANNTHRVAATNISVTSGAIYTLSLFVKAAERSAILLSFGSDSSAFPLTQAVFSLVGTGSFTNYSGAPNPVITSVGNGWYRCSITATASATTSLGVLRIFLCNGTTGGSETYTGDGTSGIYIWGAQLEQGSYPTSYIPTTTAQVTRAADVSSSAQSTRAADVATMTGTNFSSWYNQSEGTLFAEWSSFATSYSFTSRVVEFSNGTVTEIFGLYRATNLSAASEYYSSLVLQASLPLGATAVNSAYKNATAYKANDFAAAINGGAVVTDTSGVVPSVSQANIGARYDNARFINGHIKQLDYYNTRLPNAELQALSQPTSSYVPATLNLNFAQSKRLDPRVTFNRASTATYYGSNGTLKLAEANQPRFDYDPVTMQPKGLLIEEQRTNLLTYSEQFDNAAWTKSNATITANPTTAPDGTTTADKLVEDTANTSHIANPTIAPTVTAGAAYVVSVFAKSGERALFQIRCGASSQFKAIFDLSTGLISDLVGATASCQSVGSGWYRCSLIIAAADASTLAIRLGLVQSGTTTSYTGDGTSGIYLWGAQLEAGSFPTSYIPTTSAQATRAADVATMTGTNFSSWYNQSEGTLFAEYIYQGGVTVGNRIPVQISDGTSANHIAISDYAPNGDRVLLVTSGVSQGNFGTTNYTFGQPQKRSIAYKVDDAATVATGMMTVATDTSIVTPAVNQMTIGYSAHFSYSRINGHIKRIAYFPKRLANTELQALTS